MKPFLRRAERRLFHCHHRVHRRAEGYEIALPAEQAADLWKNWLAAGVKPAGLGRGIFTPEAGHESLQPPEMDETINPLAANMGWTIARQPEDWKFIGREALEKFRRDGTENRSVW